MRWWRAPRNAPVESSCHARLNADSAKVDEFVIKARKLPWNHTPWNLIIHRIHLKSFCTSIKQPSGHWASSVSYVALLDSFRVRLKAEFLRDSMYQTNVIDVIDSSSTNKVTRHKHKLKTKPSHAMSCHVVRCLSNSLLILPPAQPFRVAWTKRTRRDTNKTSSTPRPSRFQFWCVPKISKICLARRMKRTERERERERIKANWQRTLLQRR